MPRTKYIWDDENILMEKDEFGVTQKTYTLEPQLYGNLVSEFDGTDTLHHHYDALGSTRQLTDQNGDLTDDYIYDAWGNLIAHSGTSDTPFLWLGEIGYYWDAETGMYVARRRQIGSRFARWTSADPLLFVDSPNLYTVVRNRPTVASDPSGLRTLERCEICIFEELLLPIMKGVRRVSGPAHADILSHTTIQSFTEAPGGIFGRIADIAFTYGGAGAITLRNEIYTKVPANGCGSHPSPPTCIGGRQTEAAIVRVSEATLIAHELMHRIQQHALGVDTFYGLYLLEWLDWQRRGASKDEAYRCISYEVEAYAMQYTLDAFFTDPKRLAAFNNACCCGTPLPMPPANRPDWRRIVEAGYLRRRVAETTRCDTAYPPV